MQALSRLWAHPMLRLGIGLAGLGLLALAVIRVAMEQRSAPDRCPQGLLPVGSRCCGTGQSLSAGRCDGKARSCAVTQDLTPSGECVARFGVISLAGGELFIGAADWEGQTGSERFPRTPVASFRLDATEVTYQRYASCAECAPRAGEPGAPVTGISPEEAERFCRSLDGRLPSAAEWVWAAAGSAARRYPWGNTGLVCRRAAFGLLRGPCAQAGGPELCGSRPDGATPDGVLDLAGNVAEWTREAGGGFAARGGSYRSTSAAELKSWAVEPRSSEGRREAHVGFRCAYAP